MKKDSWAILSKDANNCYVGLGTSRWEAQPSGLCFYFPDFFLKNSTPYLVFDEVVEIAKDELLNSLPEHSEKDFTWDEEGREAFENAFQSLDRLQKVVPYMGFHSKLPKEPLALLKSALTYHLKHPHTTLYGFKQGVEGMVGATPEKLFVRNGLVIQTEAVAGTLPIAQRTSLLEDPKLYHEHQLVIDGIQSSLTPNAFCQAAPTEIRDFGLLSHLVTPIQATLHKPCSISNLVQVLHPTPALGAYPKASGKAWLENYALKVPRLRYGAPMGIIDEENNFAQLYVAIRNVQLTKDKSSIFAGCGIVKGSELSKELQEIQLKFNSIKAILN